MVIIKLVDLVLVMIVKILLRNQENQKVKNCLTPKNWLNQEKSCQKVRIYQILIPKKPNQTF